MTRRVHDFLRCARTCDGREYGRELGALVALTRAGSQPGIRSEPIAPPYQPTRGGPPHRLGMNSDCVFRCGSHADWVVLTIHTASIRPPME
eukprot:360073-Chlamydomonas_euryale.AAC.3